MDILGRKAKKKVKKLKEELKELQEEKQKLTEKLEAEGERRKKAVRKKQNAEKEVKELKTKIDELKDKLEKKQPDVKHQKNIRVEDLSKERTKELLDFLSSVEFKKGRLTSVYIKKDSRNNKGIPELNKIQSSRGIIFLYDDWNILRLGIIPPLPIKEEKETISSSFSFDYNLFTEPSVYSFAIIRSDIFIVGIYKNSELVFMDNIKSNIKSKHSKGGYSQKRFERKREKQISKHIQRSAEKFEQLIKNQEEEINLIAVGGEKNTIKKFKNKLQYEIVSKTLDITGERKEALEKGRKNFWKTRIHIF